MNIRTSKRTSCVVPCHSGIWLGAPITARHGSLFILLSIRAQNIVRQTARKLHRFLFIDYRPPLICWRMFKSSFCSRACRSFRRLLSKNFQRVKAAAWRFRLRSQLAYITRPLGSREDLFLAYTRVGTGWQPCRCKGLFSRQSERCSQRLISCSPLSRVRLIRNQEGQLQSLNHIPSRTLSFRSPRKFKTWISRCAERRLDDATCHSCPRHIESIRDVKNNHPPDPRVTRPCATRGTPVEALQPGRGGNSRPTSLKSAMRRKGLRFSRCS